ncbi:MAG: ABC-three component system protein [Pyrinomonadaceae bacterium]
MDQDEVRDYVVCVNGGSGVIFQPADEAFSYILTANHIFRDIADFGDQVELHHFSSADGSFTAADKFDLQKEVNYFPHPNAPAAAADIAHNYGVDAAILKVPRIPLRDKLIMQESVSTEMGGFFLVGMPSVRRENPISQNWFRIDNDVTIYGPRDYSRREAHLGNHQNWGELVGSSGGGIVKLHGDYVAIAGIQNQVISHDEGIGNVEFTLIFVYKEITDHYAGHLDPIRPYYMSSFSFLQEQAFSLVVDAFTEDRIARTREYLRVKANEVVNSDVTPYAIKSFFEKRLLLSEADDATLYTTEIWKTWLEFLTVMNIVREKVLNSDELNHLFDLVRLKYSGTEKDWLELIKTDLRYSDYQGLASGSKILIGTKSKPIGATRIPKEKLRRIDRVYDREFHTDAGQDPFTSFEFIHTEYFQSDCIIKNLEQYEHLDDEGELCAALKAEYEKLLNG